LRFAQTDAGTSAIFRNEFNASIFKASLSVSYLVCARLGIDTASDEYLAAYVRKCPVTPSISVDRVVKSVWVIEQMKRIRLGLRKAATS